MISSRRLAREWALKILYQMDVGKVSISDARDAAIERLRAEFVQRGSRSASGSTAEQQSLDFVTARLEDILATVRLPVERAIMLCLERAFSSAPYWQELIFEKSFKAKFKGYKLQPARLLIPGSEEPVFHSSDPGLPNAADLTASETTRLAEFMRDLVTGLPVVLTAEMRRISRARIAALYARFVAAGSVWDSAGEKALLEERIQFNADAIDRWQRVGQVVQKQTSDYLRVTGFTIRLVNLTDERRTEIDKLLTELSSGWRLERQVAVDRNILRLAALEMLFIPDIPASASINEAVELAKKFSTAESGRFVNGVLGAVASGIAATNAAREPLLLPDDGLMDEVIDLPDIMELDDPDTLIGLEEAIETEGESDAEECDDTEL